MGSEAGCRKFTVFSLVTPRRPPYPKMGNRAVNTSMAWDKEPWARSAVHVMEVMDDVVQEVLREGQHRELRAVAAQALPAPLGLADTGK